MSYSQREEEMQAEFGARYDDNRERYAAEIADAEAEGQREMEHYAWLAREEGFATYEAMLAPLSVPGQDEPVDSEPVDSDDILF